MGPLSKPRQEDRRPVSVVNCKAVGLSLGCTSVCALAANPHNRATEAAATPAAAATPPLARMATVRWDDSVGVRWLAFSTDAGGAAVANNGVGSSWSSSSSIRQHATRSTQGQLVLDRGEYVRLIRGRVDKHDGRLADWVTLVTSNLRTVTVGKQDGGASPNLSFIAASGHEICGLEASEDGSVAGILQRPQHGGEHRSAPAGAALFRSLADATGAGYATSASAASVALQSQGASSIGGNVSV